LTKIALDFFHEYLPFWEMQPADDLINSEGDFCFAKTGELYTIYLRNGGTTELYLGQSKTVYSVEWFNPRTGGKLTNGSVSEIRGPGKVNVGKAPSDKDKDWVVLIRRKQ